MIRTTSDDRRARVLVAFTPRASATEPVAMVSVVGGEESVIDSAVAKLSGAAYARPVIRAISRINAIYNIRFRFI
jgi:phage terminase large subunit-like protein